MERLNAEQQEVSTALVCSEQTEETPQLRINFTAFVKEAHKNDTFA